MALETAPAGANNAFTRNHTDTITIASGETTSTEFIVGGRAVTNIHLPTVSAAYFSYLVKVNPGDTAVQLVDTDGSLLTFPRGATTTTTGALSYTEAALGGFYSFELVSSASQGSDRTIGVSTRGQDPVPFVNSGSGGGSDTPSANNPNIATFIKPNVTTAGSSGAWTTANSPIVIASIVGVVGIRVWGVVTTPFTSTGGTGTLLLSFAGATPIGLTTTATANGTNLALNYVLGGNAATATGSPTTQSYYAIGNTGNIQLTIGTNNMTAGGMTIYFAWYPITDGATLTTATP